METSTDSILVKLEEFYPNPYQPPSRLKVSEEKARRGGESILRSGLIQIPVCRIKDNRYEIGDGWQRKEWFAWLVKNGHPEYDKLPVILRSFTDQEMADLIDETDENKEKLNIIERAWYWRKYLADFKSITQAEFARRRGLSQGEIANTIRLLDLPEAIQAMIISREITESHGRALLAAKDPKAMLEYAKESVKNSWPVATLDNVIKCYLNSQHLKLPETPKQKCRVCGCTEDNACMVDRKPCHWVQPDLCSACAEKTANGPKPCVTCADWKNCRGGFLYVGENNKWQCNQKIEEVKEEVGKQEVPEITQTQVETPSQTAKQPEKKKPEPKKAPTPLPAPSSSVPKPNWSRKLIIDEKQGYCLASCMKAGGLPAFRRIEGDFLHAAVMVNEWLLELQEQWSKEGK